MHRRPLCLVDGEQPHARAERSKEQREGEKSAQLAPEYRAGAVPGRELGGAPLGPPPGPWRPGPVPQLRRAGSASGKRRWCKMSLEPRGLWGHSPLPLHLDLGQGAAHRTPDDGVTTREGDFQHGTAHVKPRRPRETRSHAPPSGPAALDTCRCQVLILAPRHSPLCGHSDTGPVQAHTARRQGAMRHRSGEITGVRTPVLQRAQAPFGDPTGAEAGEFPESQKDHEMVLGNLPSFLMKVAGPLEGKVTQ